MYSWLVTVLLLATAVNNSRGAQVPITNYTCTQPNLAVFLDQGQCTVSGGLRTCAIKNATSPALLSSSADLGVYAWDSSIPPYPNPFVVLDIPQGWCVWSVKIAFRAGGSIPALGLSVHSAEPLSTNTDRTMFCKAIDRGNPAVVMMNFTTLAHVKYLRINMTSTGRVYLNEIEVFGTNDIICTHPPSAGGDPASPTNSVGSSAYSLTSTLFTPPCPASATPAMSARPTTTSVLFSSFTTTPMSLQPRTSDNPTTSGLTSTSFQPPSPPSGSLPFGPNSYVLPAIITVVAVLLVTVITAFFGIVICIITRKHKTRKSLDMQRLSSIHYPSTQSDLTFKDNQFHSSQSADANAVNYHKKIGVAPRNYTGLSLTTSNNSVVQGTAEEPVLGGDISRPTSQVSSKPTHGMVTWVNPSMLDHPFASCSWGNTMAGTDIGGNYETSPHWQHAEGQYNFQSDCQLTSKGAATDDRHRVLKDVKAQVGTTHQPPPQAPPTALPRVVVESAYADTLTEAPGKKREPSTISLTYASVDPPSSSSMLAAALPSTHSRRPKLSPLAMSPCVPQEDHIYSEVDKSRKKSASSTSSSPARLMHSTNATCDYSETDADFLGGSRNVEGDTMTQPQRITSSSTAKGAVSTHELATCVYAQVDISKKSRRGKKS